MTAASLRVLFAPDWRDGVAYQALLAGALEKHAVEVSFLQGYKRVLPLTRLCRSRPAFDILHLHWPEAYYPRMGDLLDWFRVLRFALDVRLASRRRPLVLTAHNLHAHNRGDELLAEYN